MLFGQAVDAVKIAHEAAQKVAESTNWAAYLLAIVIVGLGGIGLIFLRSMIDSQKTKDTAFVGMCNSFAAADVKQTEVLTKISDRLDRHSDTLEKLTDAIAVACKANCHDDSDNRARKR